MIEAGYRHDRLQVIEELEERYHGQKVYLCRCDCGNIKKFPSASIKKTSSCGCLLKEKNKRTFVDLTGRKFGMLVVVKRHGTENPIRWDCICDCGEETIEFGGNLTSKRKRKYPLSCGCSYKSYIDLKNKQFNFLTAVEIIEYSKSAHSMLWKCKCVCGNEKVIPSNLFISEKVKSCGCMDRVGGTSLASITTRGLNKNNTSGTRGVCYNKRQSRWIASIMFRKQKYHLGTYEDKERAIEARKEAEKKLYGNFLEWYAENYPKQWKRISRREIIGNTFK